MPNLRNKKPLPVPISTSDEEVNSMRRMSLVKTQSKIPTILLSHLYVCCPAADSGANRSVSTQVARLARAVAIEVMNVSFLRRAPRSSSGAAD